jgi:tRNA pseudouridine38-40 synthase
MRNIKLTIEYNGTNLSGWQYQPDKRTVQGEIQSALKIIFKNDIHLNGSGRTDAGVHAAGQVANFKIDSAMKPAEIVRALNGNIKDDISIICAEDVPENFHSRYSAKQKTYRYTILNRASRPALEKDYVLHVPYKINLTAMKNEIPALLGKHDFLSFTASDPSQRGKLTNKDTTRTIYDLRIQKKAQLITIEVTANGFLYKMVRNIVGTLLDVGTGNIPSGAIKKILKAKSRLFARATAPAKGLMLLNVVY